jgi:hypothetical protein
LSGLGYQGKCWLGLGETHRYSTNQKLKELFLTNPKPIFPTPQGYPLIIVLIVINTIQVTITICRECEPFT